MDLRGRYPVGRRACKRCAWSCLGARALIRGLDPREPKEGIHLSKPFKQQHACYRRIETRGNADLFAHEMRIVGGRILSREHIPFWPFKVTLLDGRSTIAMGFYCGPDLLVGELLNAGQLSRLLQGPDDERDLGGGTDVFEEGPAVRDKLRQRTSGLRNRENRECDRKPAVGRAEEDCARLLGAILLEAIHVWMSASAGRQIVSPRLTESLRHVLRCAAAVTLDPQVFGLERGTALKESQRRSTCAGPTVNEPVPRKVIQMGGDALSAKRGRTDYERQ